MKKLVLFFEIANEPSLLRRACLVSLIVGTLLNLINQGQHILCGNLALLSWPKLVLTYAVPFCVSLYSATSAKMRFDPGTRAYAELRLRCQHCQQSELSLRKGELIPPCPICLEKTDWQGLSFPQKILSSQKP
ncbi:MAG: nitrate/nitrite transporter NrtS [Verrucomicrobiales bacterium]